MARAQAILGDARFCWHLFCESHGTDTRKSRYIRDRLGFAHSQQGPAYKVAPPPPTFVQTARCDLHK